MIFIFRVNSPSEIMKSIITNIQNHKIKYQEALANKRWRQNWTHLTALVTEIECPRNLVEYKTHRISLIIKQKSISYLIFLFF